MSNKLTCPNCWQSESVEDYILATDADMAFNIALSVPVPLTNLVLKYIQLFAPAKSVFTLDRRAKLIESMHLEGCDIDRVAYGITEMLQRHASGKLKTPLKNHNYLKQVMTSYEPADESEEKKYKLTDKQIKFFGLRLCNTPEFAMKYANVGEEAGAFMQRVEAQLQNPEMVKKWYGYIETIKQNAK